jgi:Ca-activated chloride channel homolog
MLGSALVWLGWASARAGMPLASVDYAVDVRGSLAEVVVDQAFVNDTDEAIDAVYVFPLHEGAAVDGMRIVVGDHAIDGQVLDLEQAEVVYEEAVEAGHTAALTTQQRANVFTQRVGNIGPHEEVHVQLRVVQPVPHVDGAYELVLPLVVAPRFVSPAQWDQLVRDGEALPSVAVDDGGGLRVVEGLTAGIEVHVEAGLPLRSLACPSHDILRAGIAAGASVDVVTARAPLDRDFVLRWEVAAERPDASLIVQEGHLAMTFEPPAAPAPADLVPRELIWVIDQSCSMSGAPIELVRRAMLRALDHVGPRDSLRILRFSDRVEGDARSRPATPEVLEEARQQILALEVDGGTYLLDGVLAALDTPPDPQRERYVLFLTDGLIGAERSVLAAIVDRVGDARLFSLGAGATPNRALLADMARFGGGRTTWLREGEPAELTVGRFVDSISRPVLTDITIDWADWEVEEVWPRRLPGLYAGQPLRITARVVREGQQPVVVRARLGTDAYTMRVTPTRAPTGRAVPSTWARDKIAALEGEQLWGAVPEVVDEIRRTSLAYQVLSRYTAFVAVDRERVVRPPTPEPELGPVRPPRVYHVESRQGGQVEELVVMSRAKAVDAEATSSGVLLTREFLQRIPAGRAYASAVPVPGSGTPSLAGGGTENAYAVDGMNVADPVTGALPLNLSLDAIEQVEVTTAGPVPELPGAGNVANVVTRSGNNNLELHAHASHLWRPTDGAPLTAERAGGSLSGPVVREKAWVLADYAFQRSALGDEGYEGHTAFGKLTVQPNPEHRFSATAAGEVATAVPGGPQRTGLGIVRWQWFLAPEVGTEAVATTQRTEVGGETRRRDQARIVGWGLSVDDPLGGTHDVKVGADVERAGWTVDPAWASRWLGVEVAPEDEVARAGAFGQDAWKPVRNLTLVAGARVDVALGRVHLGPTLGAAWDPFGDQRTVLAVGVGRRYGHLGLAATIRPGLPETGLPQLDEWFSRLEREIVHDLAVGGSLAYRSWRGLPAFGGERADQRSLTSALVLRKISSRRWFADLSWHHTRLQGTSARVPLVDEGALAAFRDVVTGAIGWDLPTDPYTQSVGLIGAWYADPIVAVLPDPGAIPEGARWSAGVRLAQAIDVRKGLLIVELTGEWVTLLNDPRQLTDWVAVRPPLPALPGWGGPRVALGARYRF